MNASSQWHKIVNPTLTTQDSLKIGEIRSVKCKETPYCLVRVKSGYFMVNEKCPHAYGKLSQGWCDEDEKLVCPVHRLKFEVSTGKSDSDDGYAISSYPVEIREDGFYARFPEKKWFELW